MDPNWEFATSRSFGRRDLLAGAGAALGLSFASACVSARSERNKLAPSEQITIGVVGLGIRGGKILRRGLLRDPRVRVLAVCDVDTTRREHFRALVDRHYGSTSSCAAFNDDREIYARSDIDAVVIATPDHWHVTQAVAAARAGKDVYCEKPLTHTLREGELLVRVVRETGCVFQTGSQQRSEFGHRFVKAVELIRAGRIGDVLSATVGVGNPPTACGLGAESVEPGLDWDRWLGPAPQRAYHSELSPRGVIKHYPRWRKYREYSGGYLADMGAHHFDIVQWALGADAGGPIAVEPPLVEGALRGASLVYANGVRVLHGGPSGATFHGTKGLIHVDRGRLVTAPSRLVDRTVTDAKHRIRRRKSHLDDWLESIRQRSTPVCSAEIGARSAAVCQLLNLAYWYGSRFEWRPERWQFGEGGNARWLDYERREGYGLA